jgi:hypothetical protein
VPRKGACSMSKAPHATPPSHPYPRSTAAALKLARPCPETLPAGKGIAPRAHFLQVLGADEVSKKYPSGQVRQPLAASHVAHSSSAQLAHSVRGYRSLHFMANVCHALMVML